VLQGWTGRIREHARTFARSHGVARSRLLSGLKKVPDQDWRPLCASPLQVNRWCLDLSIRNRTVGHRKRPAYAKISIDWRCPTGSEDSNFCFLLAGLEHVISSQPDVGSRT
jgi:hypothetical protein